VKVLVTGGAGYIGSIAAAELVAAGHAVTILDSLVTGHAAALPAEAAFVQADLGDRHALEQVLKPGAFDAVMHFAAFIEAGESMVDPGKYFHNNLALSLQLLDAVVRAAVPRFVLSSTAAVYQSNDEAITEESPLGPANVYGQTKLMIEQALEWYHRIHGLRFAALRYFNAAGAHGGRGEAHRPESHLVPLVLQAAAGRRSELRIFGDDYPTPDGTCIRDYIHVADLVAAHRLALQALDTRPPRSTTSAAESATPSVRSSRAPGGSPDRRSRSGWIRVVPATRRAWSPRRKRRGASSAGTHCTPGWTTSSLRPVSGTGRTHRDERQAQAGPSERRPKSNAVEGVDAGHAPHGANLGGTTRLALDLDHFVESGLPRLEPADRPPRRRIWCPASPPRTSEPMGLGRLCQCHRAGSLVQKLAAELQRADPVIARLTAGEGRSLDRPIRGMDSIAGPIALTLALAGINLILVALEYGWRLALLNYPAEFLIELPLLTFFWVYASLLIGLNRLGRQRLNLEPTPGDRALGLGPVGHLAFTGFWIFSLGFAPILIASATSTPTLVFNLAFFLIGFALFVLSLNRLHQQMAEAKRGHLVIARKLYADAYLPLLDKPTARTLKSQTPQLNAAEALEKRSAGIQEWPFDEVLTGRIAIIVTSVVATVIARIVLDAIGL
jgi:UDP-glucose 4-epimerase